jgi:uncharacterized protein (DUF433 family)
LDHPISSTRPRELARALECGPARLGGVPVFCGTRVPDKSLFDHLHAGDSLDTLLAAFPGVTRDQALTVLDLADGPMGRILT